MHATSKGCDQTARMHKTHCRKFHVIAQIGVSMNESMRSNDEIENIAENSMCMSCGRLGHYTIIDLC